MFLNQKFIILVLFLFCFEAAFSQVTEPKKDSSEVYRDIQTYSKKHKFTKFLHGLIFESIDSKKKKKKIVKKRHADFDGKIIRNINIVTLDPFGYSEIDTARKPKNWGEKTGNILHSKTKKLAIRNLLLLKKNTPLDPLLVKESERLIRSQKYISRVNITLESISKTSDSVDVSVRVLDSWSIIPKGSISNTRTSFKIDERNFLGSGHEFDSKYTNRFSDGKKAYGLDYIIPNIKNTFIKTQLSYHIDLDGYYGKSIDIERPFYSPLTKWAGGIYLDQQFRKDTLQDANLIYASQNFKYNSQDYWIGHAFRIFKGNTEDEKTTNLILSGRFLNVNYLESPNLI
jgi:hypothetical protein